MNTAQNFMLTGVGGQGTLLASNILAEVGLQAGYDVKKSEVHGMAQRGGSVFSNIRLGGKAIAPLTPEGRGDVMVAVEPSEALRNIQYLGAKSVVVLNSRAVIPYTVFMGKSKYPKLEDILAKLRKVTDRVIELDATKLAEAAGNILSANVVMMGALFGSALVPITVATARAVIEARFPAKAAATNLKAFSMGYELVKKVLKDATA